MAPYTSNTTPPRSPSPEASTSGARTVPNSPTRYLYRNALTSPASIQKRNERPISFRMFSKLPLEVQDLVWQHVLNPNAPNVHGVEVRRSTRGEPGVRMVQDMLWNSNTGSIRPPVFPAQLALQQVCRRSHAAAERELRIWKAAEPYELHSDRAYVATEQVDLSRDLFVLSNQLEGDVNEDDQIQGVRYVGVTWEGMWDFHIGQKLDKALELFPDIECLYLVVAAASTVYPHLEEWSSEALPVLDAYERVCKETASVETRMEFLCQNMIYQEIPVENLYEMAGLREPLSYINDFNNHLVSLREEAEEEGREYHKPAIRVMTWAQAHGVRPRFP